MRFLETDPETRRPTATNLIEIARTAKLNRASCGNVNNWSSWEVTQLAVVSRLTGVLTAEISGRNAAALFQFPVSIFYFRFSIFEAYAQVVSVLKEACFGAAT